MAEPKGGDLAAKARIAQADVITEGRELRADLPFRYLRQQAHLTAPASDPRLAEKALSNAHDVAQRLMQRYGIDAADLASRSELEIDDVVAVLRAGGAPVVLLDLEDGVPPHMVAEARANAIALLRDVDRGSSLCFVRPAAVEDPRCADDLIEILIGAGAGRSPERFPVDGIVIPKIRHVHEYEWLDHTLTAIENEVGVPQNLIRVSFQVETGWGVLNLPALAVAAHPRLAGIILGTVDLSADLLLPEVRYRHPVCEWARMNVVATAGAVGVPAIDGMTLDFPVGLPQNSPEANRELVLQRMMLNFTDALHSIDSGMSGRWTGHPLQLVATELAFRKAFSPAVIADLVATVTSFQEATNANAGAMTGRTGELLDIGTDRHVRTVLRRAAAWGYLSRTRARELGLLSEGEVFAI